MILYKDVVKLFEYNCNYLMFIDYTLINHTANYYIANLLILKNEIRI